ncbi:tRNA (N(6)-L-threonylcarbamoyladenosine(37)-C(2))-methylthiotransferase MtaB [candidate division KSB1 bacterium]|nr:tRNA (N(6)-L-threonylcarbamoyladenosine(37)-C(2))-methylthiotransferase MtaB [candidate division KSB1 bacterium]
MHKTVSFYTLGCRLNQAETAILEQIFSNEGFRVVQFGQPSDIVVINTCTVTERGDRDTRRIINRIHRTNNNAHIALVGCQAQTQKDLLLQLPGVYWVVGNEVKMTLPELIKSGKKSGVFTPRIRRVPFTLPVSGINANRTRANLKIQDGCDFFCAYCEIPYARGRARSRRHEDLLKAAQELADGGHRELVLTGINIGMYQDSGKYLLDVVRDLSQIEKLERIRISSIEITTLPDGLAEFFENTPKLCRFLHIPLQSGCDQILQAMNRKHSTADFDRFVKNIKNQIPRICLGTDVLVGFPGETDDFFQQTLDFLANCCVSYFHVFSYSDRPHSKSRRLADKVSEQKIRRRSEILRKLSAHKRDQYLQEFIGKTEKVLFEQKKNGFWDGLTDTYIRVKVKSNINLRNQLLPVKLTEIDNQSMIGTL